MTDVDMPNFAAIAELCKAKMAVKAETKGNTWRDYSYVRGDLFLYDAMRKHAEKINPRGSTQSEIVADAVDVMNFCAMIIENATGGKYKIETTPLEQKIDALLREIDLLAHEKLIFRKLIRELVEAEKLKVGQGGQ